jgi:conjugative relaxase-like TrwC/TraI family protein
MAVAEAHAAAVDAAISYLDDHAAFSRTGKAGVRQVDTDGLVAAAFVHRTSRAGDPQLHTHVLVSGRVRCADGVWRALDSRALHRQLKPAGMVYQAALRAELTARLGVEWTAVDRHGQAEVDGVPTGLCRHFSRRRAAVEARAAERVAEAEVRLGRGLTPEERRRAYEVAVLETRTAKDHGPETDLGLHDRWHQEAHHAGFAAVSWLADTVGRQPEVAPEVAAVVTEVLGELVLTTSTWRRADVVRQVARRAPAHGDADAVRRWMEDVTDQVLDAAGVVALTAPQPQAPAELRRRDGMCVFDRHGAARYTTLATLAAEQAVVDLAEAGVGAGRGVATPTSVDAAVAAAGLGADQESAVRAVTGDGDTVVCVVGPAGAGKSRTMGAAAAAWRESGIPVRGLALSAVAAGVLETEAGIGADTVAKLLFEHDRPGGPHERWALRTGEVVVVDEAGMVSSADLVRLAHMVEQAQAKLVLVGDHAQLGAVEAGGLFRLLAETRAVVLDTVRRFSSAWEAEASLRLRDRDASVLELYDAHGRIRGCDRLEAADAAVATWHDARAAGESVVICASDHASVDAVARRIRAGRVAAGEVEPGGVVAGDHRVGVGDEVVTCRNDRRLMTSAGAWVRNGDRWAVTERFADGSLAVASLDGRGRVVLPAGYVSEEVTLAYALTIHKAQGVTVDRAVLVADDATTAEALYVGMTRGRHHNAALVVCDRLDDEHRTTRPEALEVLAGALGRVSAEQAALDVLRAELAASESLATLAPRLANLDAWITRETPPDPSVELRRLDARRHYLERTARPGVLTRAWRDDRRALAELDARRGEFEAMAEDRSAWLADHAETLAYRDELAAQVFARRTALGLDATVTQPPHLVELLGPVPDGDGQATTWVRMAGRIEAYREQWGVEPDELGLPPNDGVQYREWSIAVHTAEMLNRLDAPHLEHAVDHGLELGL